MGLLQKGFRRDDAGHDMTEQILLRISPQPVCILLRAGDGSLCPAQLEAVPCLLRFRLVRRVHDIPFRSDRNPLLQGQVAGCQVLQEGHAPRSVRYGMEKLDGNPVLIIQNAYAAFFQFPPGHRRQGPGVVFLRLRRFVHRLQVIPEETCPQPYEDSRKPGQQILRCPAQEFRIHRLLQRHRNPENIVPVFSHYGRKNQRGVIQPVPLLFHDPLSSR